MSNLALDLFLGNASVLWMAPCNEYTLLRYIISTIILPMKDFYCMSHPPNLYKCTELYVGWNG